MMNWGLLSDYGRTIDNYMYMYMYEQSTNHISLKKSLDVKSPHCIRHVSANTRPYQLYWDD